MTLRHLRVFIVVAETGKMSDAAKKLFIAQPSVSQTISEIEEEYGIKLFERLSRKLYITPVGEQFLGYARHVISLFEEMEQQIKYSSQASLLKMGATVTVGTCVISDVINTLKQHLPLIKTQMNIGNTRQIEDKILKSELDIALVEGVVKNPDLIFMPVMRDELVLACSVNHPFASRKYVTPLELSREPFVIREKGSGTRELFENYMNIHNLPINESWICNNSEAIKHAVCDNQGVTVISKRLLVNEIAEHKLVIVPVEDCSLNRFFSIVYHKNKYITPAISAFIDACRANDKEF